MKLYAVSRKGATFPATWLEDASRVNVDGFRRVFQRVEKFESVLLSESELRAFNAIAPTLRDWDPDALKVSPM